MPGPGVPGSGGVPGLGGAWSRGSAPGGGMVSQHDRHV